MTPTEQDKELREKLDIRDRLKSLSIFKLGFGFDTDELIDFITADRKRVALEARIDELSEIPQHPNFLHEYIEHRIAQLEEANHE